MKSASVSTLTACSANGPGYRRHRSRKSTTIRSDPVDPHVCDYLHDLKVRQRAPKTLRGYRSSLQQSLRILQRHGRSTDPARIEQADIDLIMTEYAGLAVATRHWHIAILAQYLQYAGNDVISHVGYLWPQDWRTGADWLDTGQTRAVLNAVRTPAEALVVDLELRLGLRRVEVIRLRPQDVDFAHSKINVRGKGISAASGGASSCLTEWPRPSAPTSGGGPRPSLPRRD